MTEPTDAELEDAYDSVPAHGNQHAVHIAGLRAVLAKWGTPPAVAGDPVGKRVEFDRIDMIWFNGSPPVGALLYTTPQPTQAQAGAVPLPKSYQGSVLTSSSHDSGCRVSFSFGSVAEAEAWHESIIDRHHGIKGGQHGPT